MSVKWFECLICGHEFSFVDDASPERNVAICPHCYGKNTRRVIRKL